MTSLPPPKKPRHPDFAAAVELIKLLAAIDARRKKAAASEPAK